MDEQLLASFRRFLKTDEIEEVYKEAMVAKTGMLSEVTITSVSFEGGSSSGVIKGDPSVLMEVCEFLLTEEEAKNAGTPVTQASGVVDFSQGYIGT